MGSLIDAMRLAQQYNAPQGLDVQPRQYPQPPPLMPMQAPPPPINSGPSTGQQLSGLGNQLLGQYKNRKKSAPAADNPQETPSPFTADQFGPGLQSFGDPDGILSRSELMGAREFGGPVQQGSPYLMGEDGPEELDTQGGQQIVGQNGPQVVTPAQSGTVVPNPLTRARVVNPASDNNSQVNNGSYYDPNQSDTRPRIVDKPQFLMDRITDRSANPSSGTSTQPMSRGKSALLSGLLGLQRGLATGGGWGAGLSGAVAGAATGGISPDYGQRELNQALNQQDQQRVDQLQKNQQGSLKDRMLIAQTYGQYANAGYKQQKAGIDQQRADIYGENASERQRHNQADEEYKFKNLDQRGKQKQVDRLVKMYGLSDSFDPDDPADADMAAQLKAAGLPAPKKTAKDSLQLVQDPETGAWSAVSRKTGGVKDVTTDNGDQFKTTPKHLITVAEMDHKAALESQKQTTKEGKARASDMSYADSWDAAAQSYDQVAKNSYGAEARTARGKAIAARQKAAGFRNKWGVQTAQPNIEQ